MKYNKNEIIGRMRDRITIQNVTRSKSGTGYASESWADITSVWANAEIKLPQSNETVIDGKNTAKNISDFTIRYTTDISEESRIVWNGKLYQVRNIKVSHDRRFISFQGEFYDSYIITGVSVAAILSANASLSSNFKIIQSVLAAMNAIATTNAELTVSQQGQVLAAANLSASGNVSASVTKVIPINSDVTANGNLSASLTKAININSSLNANATLVSDALVSKTLISTLNANATTLAAVDVVTQGSVSVNAALNALGSVTADIKRTVTLQSSPTTSASTALDAKLTKVIDASMSAAATTQSSAQLTIAVNAAANATANTTADATLSYTVNAQLNATAQTTVDAKITRIISAEMTATAQTSVEAGIGVTFVSSLMASGSVTNASITRTATLAASVSGAATVTNSNLQLFDPNYANVSLLLHGNGTDGSTTFIDNSVNVLTVTGFGNAQIDTAIKKFGTGSLQFDGNGDYLRVNGGSLFDFGTGSFTMECFVYLPTGVTQGYIMGTRTDDTGTTIRWNIYISTNVIVFNAYNTSNVLIGTVVHQTTLTNNVFNHIAVVRNVNEFAIYLNGVKSTTNVTNSTALANSNLTIDIGQATGGFGGSGLPLNGYIDDLRITKGVARYTADFTPPSREFLDQ
jgi:SPP1 family predicted phage head-tail adaptor